MAQHHENIYFKNDFHKYWQGPAPSGPGWGISTWFFLLSWSLGKGLTSSGCSSFSRARLREVLGHWWRAPRQSYCKLCMGTDDHYTFFVVSIFELYRIAKSRYWTPEANAISHVGCPSVNDRKRERLGSGARQTWIQNPSLPRVRGVGLSCDATKLALGERILVVPSDGKTGGGVNELCI